MFHQDRRRVGADRVEGTLAKRKLAAATGQDVQRQYREAVDQSIVIWKMMKSSRTTGVASNRISTTSEVPTKRHGRFGTARRPLLR